MKYFCVSTIIFLTSIAAQAQTTETLVYDWEFNYSTFESSFFLRTTATGPWGQTFEYKTENCSLTAELDGNITAGSVLSGATVTGGIMLAAADTSGAPSTATFTLTLLKNGSPIGIDTLTVAEDEVYAGYNYSLATTDSFTAADAITLRVTCPAGAGELRGFMLSKTHPDYSKIVFPIQQAANHAPVLAAIGNKSVNEATNLSFTVTATDEDDDTLTYACSNLPEGATFTPATRQFSWTPTHAQAGTYPDIVFTVSDGDLEDSESITITVNDVQQGVPIIPAIDLLLLE